MAEELRLNPKYDLDGEYVASDSEDGYSSGEKKLLSRARNFRNDDSGSEEEVYGFSDSQSDDEAADRADSDIEGQEGSGDDIPDPKAWGQKKKSFYSTDYVDEDYGGFGKEEQAATLEEKEARILQNRLAEQLGDEDFSLEFFTDKKINDKNIENDPEIFIKSDLSQLSKRQKLQLLQKESPEFLGLVDDYKVKLALARDSLRPVLELVKSGRLPECPPVRFIRTAYDIILHYCTNISFYIMLKLKKISIQNHPVIKRLYQYRQMLNQIEPIYESDIKPQVEKILIAVEQNISFSVISADNPEAVTKSTKRKTSLSSGANSKRLKLLNNLPRDTKKMSEESTECAFEANSDDSQPDENDSEEEEKVIPDDDKQGIEDMSKLNENTDDPGDLEKRAITYQMAKNKGLTPHRKKEQRNPRVKHRNKYRKAKIRRKGAIREVRTEVSRYAGEVSGIKSNVKKSIKIR